MSYSPPPFPDRAVYVFIDGTNLLSELATLRLKLPDLGATISLSDERHYIHKIFLYTTEEKQKKAIENHGDLFFNDIRVILGLTVGAGTNTREKGVDAQLVADMIFHAASRNAQHILLVANDADFSFALRRVEDFGCTTEVLWFGKNPCTNLLKSADSVRFLSVDDLKDRHSAVDA